MGESAAIERVQIVAGSGVRAVRELTRTIACIDEYCASLASAWSDASDDESNVQAFECPPRAPLLEFKGIAGGKVAFRGYNQEERPWCTFSERWREPGRVPS